MTFTKATIPLSQIATPPSLEMEAMDDDTRGDLLFLRHHGHSGFMNPEQEAKLLQLCEEE